MARQTDEERVALLAQVASWYYEDNLGLGTIAKRIDRSVSLVSRLLQAARERGLVEIRINYPKAFNAAMEEQLMSSLPLERAHVVAASISSEAEASLRHFGSVAADLITADLQTSPTIGTSWGTHVHSVVSAMRTASSGNGIVVQVSGSVDAGDPTVDGAQVAQLLANKLGKDVRTLHAPLAVESESTANALRTSRSNAQTLRLAASAKHLLIGVGAPYQPNAGLRRAGYLTDKDVAQLKHHRAVGDIAGYHLNIDGEVLDVSFNRRIIGIHPESMRKLHNVMVVATGSAKVKPILAAVRGRYVTTLITDAATAAGVLREIQ